MQLPHWKTDWILSFDDNELLLKLYEELIIAHTGMGNTAKANQYKQLVQKLK
jgi:hypothetical protein